MMTTPNSSIYGGIQDAGVEDCVQGLVSWLKTKEPLMDLLGHYLDILPNKPFIFPHVSLMSVQGKQTNAVVVRYAGEGEVNQRSSSFRTVGGGVTPTQQSSLHFPRVALDFWCDHLRDDDGDIADLTEAYVRVLYIYTEFNKYLHRPAALPGSSSKIEYWGSVRTLECHRVSELTISATASSDAPVTGTVTYGVIVG